MPIVPAIPCHVRKMAQSRQSQLPLYAFLAIEGLFLSGATGIFFSHDPGVSLGILLVLSLLGTTLSIRACVQALRS